MRGTLSFSQGIEIEDGEDVASRTGLDFGISSATRTETFGFSLGTDLFGDFSSGAGDTFDVKIGRASCRERV